MKKILFILTSPNPYGAEISILTNITYLSKIKKISPIFIIRSKGKLEEFLKKKGYEFYISPFFFWVSKKKNYFKSIIKLFFNLILSIQFYFKLRKKKINYVYTNTFTTHFGLILSLFLKSKHIFHIRELAEKQFGLTFDFDRKKIFNLSEKFSFKILTNSNFLLENLKKHFKKKIFLIPNPVDDKFNKKNKMNFKKKLKIIFVGRLMEDQNPFLLIDIFKKYKTKNIQLDVYGEGPLKNELAEKIKKEKIGNIIKLKDYKDKIYNILKNYSIGLSLAKHQTFNRTIVEYMKSGILVLANNSGNNPFLIDNNKNGFLIKKNNSRLYQDKILMFYKNKKMLRKFSHSAYKKFKNKFTVKDSSMKLYRVINE